MDAVSELFREQPDVERVHDGAHGRNREVRFQVLLGVPTERADAVFPSNTEPPERLSELLGSVADLRVRGDLVTALPDRDHPAVLVEAPAVLE